MVEMALPFVNAIGSRNPVFLVQDRPSQLHTEDDIKASQSVRKTNTWTTAMSETAECTMGNIENRGCF